MGQNKSSAKHIKSNHYLHNENGVSQQLQFIKKPHEGEKTESLKLG